MELNRKCDFVYDLTKVPYFYYFVAATVEHLADYVNEGWVGSWYYGGQSKDCGGGEVAGRVYKTHASRFNSDRLHQAGIYHISATPEPLEPQSPVTPQALPATM
jgi:hypothetical protein